MEVWVKNCGGQSTSEEDLFISGRCGNPNLSSMPSALAIFTCRPNSHPFQERHVYLDEPVKIGRSVARCRPAQNNATFDCKVLSRNHALVWFDHKTGKVRRFLYLKIMNCALVLASPCSLQITLILL